MSNRRRIAQSVLAAIGLGACVYTAILLLQFLILRTPFPPPINSDASRTESRSSPQAVRPEADPSPAMRQDKAAPGH